MLIKSDADQATTQEVTSMIDHHGPGCESGLISVTRRNGGLVVEFPGQSFGEHILIITVFQTDFFQIVPELPTHIFVDVDFERHLGELRSLVQRVGRLAPH